MKSWLIGKDSDAGKDWGQEEKGITEDEMAGWRHWLDGHEFEWIPGVGDGQGGLACCNSWGCKESDMTERLNWTDIYFFRNMWAIWPSGNLKFEDAQIFSYEGLRKYHVFLELEAERLLYSLTVFSPSIKASSLSLSIASSHYWYYNTRWSCNFQLSWIPPHPSLFL